MKKISLFILTIIFVFGMVSCGGGDDKVEPDPVDETHITFGMYPQNQVFDETLISILDSQTPDSNGYYEYEGKQYMFLDSYYEVAPISWTKIEVNGKNMYISDVVLDQHEFLNTEYFEISIYPYSNKPGTPTGTFANNYEYSDLREFLNNEFYNLAFSSEEKAQLGKIDFDGLSDYIYTLSIADLSYEFQYAVGASAYAVKRGVEQTYDNDITNEFNGNVTWWLRTPNEVQLWRSAGVSFEGTVLEYIDCHFNKIGIRPVIYLTK